MTATRYARCLLEPEQAWNVQRLPVPAAATLGHTVSNHGGA